MDSFEAGRQADELIAKEVTGQDKMWGVSNDRADASRGELLLAALAQQHAVNERRCGKINAFDPDKPTSPYPDDWSGFRSYGGDVPNLVVAAAYLRQEIKRLIVAGEDTTRLSRTTPYSDKDQPTQPFPTSVPEGSEH